MTNPPMIISQARQRSAPSTWLVFTRKRRSIRTLIGGTPDPDPLLVFTPECVVEYIKKKKPLSVIYFDQVREISLRAEATSMSDSSFATLHIWLDVHYHDGTQAKWKPSACKDEKDLIRAIQYFIETYSVRKALRASRGA